MNRPLEYLCIITLTVSLILIGAMLETRLRPAPDVSGLRADLDKIMLERGIDTLTPTAMPVAELIEPQKVK